MKKNILLTYDYELSLGGKSGSVQKCMIEPTNLTLDVLKQNNAKAIFFIDTPYLVRLEEMSRKYENAKKNLTEVKDQLVRMANEGHYVFHHMHPHWFDAVYIPEENQWDLSNKSKFVVNELTDSEREKIFSESSQVLNQILASSTTQHKPDGFRAGGLYIEPFSAFKPYFIEHNIKYEFSAVPNLVRSHEKYFYDFSRCPKEPIYRFENEVAIKDEKGSFIEFSVSMHKLKGLRKILYGVYYRLNKLESKRFTDGQSISQELNDIDQANSAKKYFESDNILSVELMNPILNGWFKKLAKRNDYLHFLSHPKLLSLENIKYLDLFLKTMNRKYSVEYDFKKMGIQV